MNVGIIGTRMVGSQIALRLAHKGHEVTVFNRDRSKSEKLRKSGLTVADHPSEIGHVFSSHHNAIQTKRRCILVTFHKSN
jgi:3-hydroxyisobutyrate dehydrogenase-like beta-hydroxyacid dehydrogenase